VSVTFVSLKQATPKHESTVNQYKKIPVTFASPFGFNLYIAMPTNFQEYQYEVQAVEK